MKFTLWEKAKTMADKTPPARHRGVDFLRAASICVVVLGHWIMAAPWVDESGSHIAHMLVEQTWTQWLTWGLQVMPVFFFVGGYANGISWSAALRDNKPYGEWLSGRLARLLGPALPLVLFWGVISLVAGRAGVPPAMIKVGSQIALVPTWFLAVYLLAVLLVPLAYGAWERFGPASFWAPALVAVALDYGYFRHDLHSLGWLNFFFVWGAVHQLGLAWLKGRMGSGWRGWMWAITGLVSLVLLTEYGPWPRSLVGVPGAEVSNTTPPHLPLLALAALQFGLVRILEAPLRKWLEGARAWAATIVINGMIMTVFLWHSTVMMLMFGLALLLDGTGLWTRPGSGEWWLVKLVWIGIFVLVLIPVVAVVSRWERPAAGGAAPSALRLVAGSLLIGFGLAMMAHGGVVDGESGNMNVVALMLPLAGAFIAGMFPRRSSNRKPAGEKRP
jgi:hypothetical protein